MYKLLIGIVFFTVSFSKVYSANILEKDQENVHITVKKGDSIHSLLDKYSLSNIQCNVKAFYKINELNDGDILYYGKSYELPIRIYQYNGKSIRSTIGIDDYNKALRIQKWNESLEISKIKSKTLYGDNVLWVPYHEIECDIDLDKNNTSNEPLKPSKSSEDKYVFDKIFGQKYSSVKTLDYSLKNKVFYVVSGHGGPDPGAICTSVEEDMCEDEYAYDVSLRLARDLMQHGAIVHMIVQDPNDGIRDEQFLECDKDETCMSNQIIPLNQLARLNQRAAAINQLYKKYKSQGINDQRAIIIHVDSRGKNQKQDVFFYHLEGSKSGQKMAENLHKTFDKMYDKHQKNRGYEGFVESRGLYMLRNTLPPAVYVELANIRNKYDHKRLIYASNRQALANWMFEAIIK